MCIRRLPFTLSSVDTQNSHKAVQHRTYSESCRTWRLSCGSKRRSSREHSRCCGVIVHVVVGGGEIKVVLENQYYYG